MARKMCEAEKIHWKLVKENDKLEKQVTRNIGRKEHAKIVRDELKKAYPDIKFSVTTQVYAGGDSVHVEHCGNIDKKKQEEIKLFVRKFNGYASDLLDGRYNVGFMYNGERLRGASHCFYNGKKCGT